MRGNTKDIGQLGEEVACRFLTNNGFEISNRNYLKKWGELDIVAKRGGQTHFFEVKSVTVDASKRSNLHAPEENVHALKVRHMRRVVECYLAEYDPDGKSEFFAHVLCVFLDFRTRNANVRWIKNIIL